MANVTPEFIIYERSYFFQGIINCSHLRCDYYRYEYEFRNDYITYNYDSLFVFSFLPVARFSTFSAILTRETGLVRAFILHDYFQMVPDRFS